MLITDDHQLRVMCDGLLKEPFCAIDVEFVWNSTYRPAVALIQIASPAGEVWLVDPLAISDPSPLAEVLRQESCVKVLHACSQDLTVFQLYLGVLPTPLVDTQVAASMVARGYSLSYAALVDAICGVALSKGQQRSDWLQRPLSQAQLEYGEAEVRFLVKVYEALKAELEERGRWDWILEEGEALCRACEYTKPAWKTVSGHGSLRPRQLTVLSQLADWRDARAKEVDRPVRWVLKDDVLMDLAVRQPRNLDGVREIPGITSKVADRIGRDLLTCIETGLATPDADLLRPPRQGRPTREEQARSKGAIDLVRKVATEAGVAPELLGPRRLVESLVRRVDREGQLALESDADDDDDRSPGDDGTAATHPLLRGWRGTLLAERMRDALTPE